jgi:AcrR family transcriptional regulator
MVSKDKIIRTASKLFVEKGFEKTTMEDIANTLGVHKGSLYHHIKSKAGIFYDTLMMSFNEPAKRLEKVVNANTGPEEKFRRLVLVHFKNIEENSLEYQILLNERRHMLDHMQERIIRKKMKSYENYFLKVLKEGVRKQVFRNDLNARVIVAGIIAAGNATYKWFSVDGPLSFDEVARVYTEFFLSGIKIHK